MRIISEKKRYARVEINGVEFILDKKEPVPYEHYLNGYRDIHDAYGRPSVYKCAIWREWDYWHRENGGYCVISSKNCNFFSLTGYVNDKETGKRYMTHITYANQYLYEVEG